jgi:formylglycine-generating enzyme required for sulfatase activity
LKNYSAFPCDRFDLVSHFAEDEVEIGCNAVRWSADRKRQRPVCRWAGHEHRHHAAAEMPRRFARRTQAGCAVRVVRGGAWTSDPPYLRSASRYKNVINDHGSTNRGFRAARDLAE